jgi:two-component system chemotaxis response regulator CheY
MSKKVVLVGHCGPDSSYLRLAVSRAIKDSSIVAVEDDSMLEKQIDSGIDLLLLNRQLDFGFDTEDGVKMIQQLRAKYPLLKMMLISNYPEAQAAAVAAGALPGFGKGQIGRPAVTELLQAAIASGDESAKPSPRS